MTLYQTCLTPEKAEVFALQLLGHVLTDATLRDRFLAVTGLAPADLWARAGTAAVQLAVLDFLAGNESDLVAVAAATGIAPTDIAAARARLSE
jgi:hypothetical protein